MSDEQLVMIFKLEPGDQFEYYGDKYVRGNYADERSIRATCLTDGRSSSFMSPTLVRVTVNG